MSRTSSLGFRSPTSEPPFTYTQTPSGALGVALGGRRVGHDFDILKGERLAALKTATALLKEGKLIHSRAPALLILYQSGFDGVCIKTDKLGGKRLRRWLRDDVFPFLRRIGNCHALPDDNPLSGYDAAILKVLAYKAVDGDMRAATLYFKVTGKMPVPAKSTPYQSPIPSRSIADNLSSRAIETWWFECLQRGYIQPHLKWTDPIPVEEIYRSYQQEVVSSDARCQAILQTLYVTLQQYCPDQRLILVRDVVDIFDMQSRPIGETNEHHCYLFPPLGKCRTTFAAYVERKINWML